MADANTAQDARGLMINCSFVRYGILDEFGAVVRWVLDKPTQQYSYVTKRAKRQSLIDWENYEPAIF